jgi:hypothetical protein
MARKKNTDLTTKFHENTRKNTVKKTKNFTAKKRSATGRPNS